MNTRYTFRWFWPTLATVSLCFLLVANDATTQSTSSTKKPGVETAGGLTTITFYLEQGEITVKLPDDMRAGDTISGTVVSEPKRGTPQEVAEHQAKMSLYNIKLRTAKTLSGPSDLDVTIPLSAAITPFTFNIPKTSSVAGTSPTNIFPWVAAGDPGRVDVVWYGSTGVQVNPTWTEYPSTLSPKDFSFPQIGQPGRPVEINGPFGIGNSILMYGPARSSIQDFEKNTENVSGGFGLIQPLAKSPRRCVFEAPTNVTGPIELYLKEGNIQTKGEYRNVGVNLTAPKTSLLKGESTELHVEVSGLQGIKEPVRLTLESHGVITMEGGTYQPLVIQPSQVGADGRYSTMREITGVQTGIWGATATVVTHRFDVCLQDDSSPQRVILINTFTGDYIFPQPGGANLGGSGTITMKGCIFTLSDNRPDRRVQGQIDPCIHTGSASVQIVLPKVNFTITDRNTTNNTCAVH